jgi:hypothetical protein
MKSGKGRLHGSWRNGYKKLWADDPDQSLWCGGKGFCRLKRYDKKMEE